MLDHRVYRAAFLPALVAVLVVAFSLSDPPAPVTTRVAPDAFDTDRAFGRGAEPAPDTLLGMLHAFPRRRPGDPAAEALADFLQQALARARFVEADEVRRLRIEGETVDGRAPVDAIVAEREGLSSRRVVVVAHRDARGLGAAAELSGTAVLLELARIFADRDLARTLVLASVSGGTGGYAGARELARRLGEVDAVLVLGDMASRRTRRPWVVPWSTSGRPGPHALRRTVEAALFAETGAPAGSTRAAAQWARRAVPVTVGEQGVLNAEGTPAVLVSATGEIGPAADAQISRQRFAGFGRSVVRAVSALDGAGVETTAAGRTVVPDERPADPDGIVTADRMLPAWAVRLLAITLLLPVLLASVDAFFRARRRRLVPGRWMMWAAAWSLPFVLAWGLLRVLDLTGAVPALPAPAPPGAVGVSTAEALALGGAVLLTVVGVALMRPLVSRRIAPPGSPAAGGGAAGTGLLICLLTAVVWLFNPYAACVLLPAAHAWVLASVPESRLRGPLAVAALVAGLVLPGVLALYFVLALDLVPVEAVRLVFDVVAGGEVSPLDAAALSLFAGAACATAAILAARRRASAAAPPEPVRTRGPRTYAGPGSLGGTESALRR